MPYPESCPECEGTFRNSGSHYTARRSEVGRHVLLELGCQTTSRRFWWDFTAGAITTDARTPAAPAERRAAEASQLAAVGVPSNGHNGHATYTNGVVTVNTSTLSTPSLPDASSEVMSTVMKAADSAPQPEPRGATRGSIHRAATSLDDSAPGEQHELAGATPDSTAGDVRTAFLRQLELDRLTLRQVRGWLANDDARRAAEVAASATEATYERLALALFGASLASLQGLSASAQQPGLTAEEKLEIQREKARIRARQRRAALKAARTGQDAAGSVP